MSEFLNMGGYAAFVWPAFIITAIVMIANLVVARRLLASRIDLVARIAARKGSKS